MNRFVHAIFILLFALFAIGCNNRPDPTEDEVKTFFLKSSTIAPVVKEGRLKITAFNVVKDSSRKIADQELFRAKFTAEVNIQPAKCLNQPESSCTDAGQTQEITGTAEYEWDGDGWSEAGIIVNQ